MEVLTNHPPQSTHCVIPQNVGCARDGRLNTVAVASQQLVPQRSHDASPRAPVFSRVPIEKAFVNQIPAERRVVVVELREDCVNLSFQIVDAGLELKSEPLKDESAFAATVGYGFESLSSEEAGDHPALGLSHAKSEIYLRRI
jgi:hypothetical protein